MRILSFGAERRITQKITTTESKKSWNKWILTGMAVIYKNNVIKISNQICRLLWIVSVHWTTLLGAPISATWDETEYSQCQQLLGLTFWRIKAWMYLRQPEAKKLGAILTLNLLEHKPQAEDTRSVKKFKTPARMKVGSWDKSSGQWTPRAKEQGVRSEAGSLKLLEQRRLKTLWLSFIKLQVLFLYWSQIAITPNYFFQWHNPVSVIFTHACKYEHLEGLDP